MRPVPLLLDDMGTLGWSVFESGTTTVATVIVRLPSLVVAISMINGGV